MTKNTRYPGRPGYTGPRSGYFTLIHHGRIVEYSHDIFERVAYIRTQKALSERACRLHCIVYVRPSELPAEVAKAGADLKKAYTTLERARAEYYNVGVSVLIPWRRADNNLGLVSFLYRKILRQHKEAVVALLTKYVPDHTWNGHELVFS